MSSEPLREYLLKLEQATDELNKAFQERDIAENVYKVAKSKVMSLVNQRDLIREKIMAEKLLIRELK